MTPWANNTIGSKVPYKNSAAYEAAEKALRSAERAFLGAIARAWPSLDPGHVVAVWNEMRRSAQHLNVAQAAILAGLDRRVTADQAGQVLQAVWAAFPGFTHHDAQRAPSVVADMNNPGTWLLQWVDGPDGWAASFVDRGQLVPGVAVTATQGSLRLSVRR
ncbi:hypothetical protein IU459_34690 [Nocardia amamiensis]|uniref:Uncharacterized protein n=1 Tax=Nocardia amamiensis TaxID=404578 RepID=A0ABS0D1D3_9NOCA|nr:hypothetical protein [Nocardia amamiensis]MBF6302648.1 hypothetical protein [Nocardia amamiensis]